MVGDAAPQLSARALIELAGEFDPAVPVYEALSHRVRLLILDGRIPVGTRLPSERELAERSGRSRTTIVAAYRALRDAGYLVSRRGSGSRATLPPRGTGGPGGGDPIDFARAVPPPVDGLAAILDAVAGRMGEALRGPGFDLLGNLLLRDAIARRYTERGLATTPEQIMVTMGAQHAISLAAHTLLARGDVALVETPTYPHAVDALRRAGARLVATPVSSEGWDVEHLLDTIGSVRPAVAYLVPDFHNPTGASLPVDARPRLVEQARRAGTTLIVDETTADLGIDRDWDDGPLARHLRGRAGVGGAGALTVGSLSKSIWGGLRLGWIRADAGAIRRLAQARPAGDLGTPQLEQLLGERIVREMPALLAQRRAQLLAHRDALIELVGRRLPAWRLPRPAGGLSLWAQLDRPGSSALAALCEARGMSLVAGPAFSVDGAHERFLRLPFTSPIADLDAGVRELEACWTQLSEGRAPGRGDRSLPVVV